MKVTEIKKMVFCYFFLCLGPACGSCINSIWRSSSPHFISLSISLFLLVALEVKDYSKTASSFFVFKKKKVSNKCFPNCCLFFSFLNSWRTRCIWRLHGLSAPSDITLSDKYWKASVSNGKEFTNHVNVCECVSTMSSNVLHLTPGITKTFSICTSTTLPVTAVSYSGNWAIILQFSGPQLEERTPFFQKMFPHFVFLCRRW